MTNINVLSLFDGMSCGSLALDEAGIGVNKYYASELDKYAITVAQENYPDNIQLGDVTKWREWDIDWGSIDLLIGGSPCQGFSFAGKQLAFDDPRSKLFFTYVDILNEIEDKNPNVKFLLENVRMKKEQLDVISDYLDVEPVMINSSLVSAQNRVRYYWTNWDFGQPEDKGILLKDVIDNAVKPKAKTLRVGGRGSPAGSKQEWDGVYLSDSAVKDTPRNRRHTKELDEKSRCMTSTMYKGAGNNGMTLVPLEHSVLALLQRDSARVKGVTFTEDGIRPHKGDARKTGISEMGRILYPEAKKTYALTTSHAPKIIMDDGVEYNKATIIGRWINKRGVREDYNKEVPITQCLEVRGSNTTKSGCLTTVAKDNVLSPLPVGRYIDVYNKKLAYRKLTVGECEKLQTVPVGYTNTVSNSQRYKMLGNGWTVDVIAHILRSAGL